MTTISERLGLGAKPQRFSERGLCPVWARRSSTPRNPAWLSGGMGFGAEPGRRLPGDPITRLAGRRGEPDVVEHALPAKLQPIVADVAPSLLWPSAGLAADWRSTAISPRARAILDELRAQDAEVAAAADIEVTD